MYFSMESRIGGMVGLWTARGLLAAATIAMAGSNVAAQSQAQSPTQSPTQSKEEIVAELKAKAADLAPFTINVVGLTQSSPEFRLAQSPFWTEMVPEWSDGKITVNLRNSNELNIGGADAYRLLRTGVLDIADTVANYGAGEVPSLNGFDLAGLSPSFELITQVIEAQSPAVAQDLEAVNLKLLGAGLATAQVFWCNAEVVDLESLKGKRVRTSSSTIADLLSELGAIPVTMAFQEAAPAMQRGVIDCIITGAATGNFNKFWEIGTHVYAFQIGWAPLIRIAGLSWWNSLDPAAQEWLTKASEYYWEHVQIPLSRRNTEMGIWCSTGDDRCEATDGFERADMELATINENDLAIVKKAVEAAVLPAFVRDCGQECADEWNATVGELLGVTAAAAN